MDVIKAFLYVSVLYLRIIFWVMVKAIEIILWIIKKIFSKPIPRLPTGEEIIRYADGKEVIVLEHKRGKTRHVPRTPEAEAQIIANRKPWGPIKRFITFLGE